MGTAKKRAKKAPTTKKKTAAKKPVKKATPKVTGWKSFFRRRTIAEKKVLWKSGKPLAVLRWVAMIPLAFFAYVFKFVMAGYSFTALVCCALIGILLFYSCAHLLEGHFPKPVTIVRRIFTVCLCIGLLVVGITECLIIKASFGDPREKCEYMVVLGAKVRADGPSVSLMDRINAAYAYMTEHPDVIAVVSGGQGPDEHMSEAQCMYDHLVARGIDPERVWMEDKATSTWENLHFSLDLIEAKTGTRPEKIGLLSSEYHMFRAGLFADACGVESVGIPARTSRFSQRVNHFMREVAGVWHYLLLGGQYD
jgi:uncharacterized SAM-binding protein YcdF (DUF218 family)